MTNDMSVEQLLVWRLAQADADAPPAPRAARLLDLIRPWWEVWPERFQEYWGRLSAIQLVYGHAMTEPLHVRSSHPVAALIAHAEGVETFARVLYLSVRDSQLRLRFPPRHDSRAGGAVVRRHLRLRAHRPASAVRARDARGRERISARRRSLGGAGDELGRPSRDGLDAVPLHPAPHRC